VAIWDAKGNLVVLSRDAQGLGTTSLAADLPAGTYTVSASMDGTGFYEVGAKFSAHGIPACGAALPLSNDGGYIQRLGAGSCRGPNGGLVDFYEFTLPSEAVTAMILTSNQIDAHLTLLDAGGSALRSDDDGYGMTDSLIVQHLPAGTYRLAARAASGTQGGLYQVDVRTIFGPRPAFCGARSTVPVGGSVSGTIDFSGCQYPDGVFADMHRMVVTAEASLDIRLTSAAYDAYLLLLDGKGNLLDRDDEGGGDRNARIVRTLAPGTYFVVAKPASGVTSGGAYTLSAQ
jgi:hypothetical protein